jgi:hypothetical protein
MGGQFKRFEKIDLGPMFFLGANALWDFLAKMFDI